MEWMTYIISVVTSLILVKFLPSYLSEKAKNLATKEDIEEITKKIENIKTENKIKIDKEIRKFSKEEKAYDELKSLYIKIHEMIEEAIKTTKNNSFHNLNTQFSKLTAEVQIIASEKVIEKYLNVANLFQDWANIYRKAYPNTNILYSKSIDPTLKYKENEKEIYSKFDKEYQELIKMMRTELKWKN